MKRLALSLVFTVLCAGGCARQVTQLHEFSAVRVADDAVTFVSAPNRLTPVRDASDSVAGQKTLRRGESMRLIDEHGTLVYEVCKITSETVVLKETTTFYVPDAGSRQSSRMISVRPYEQRD